MKNVANTIEDLLEILAGLQGQSKMQIESSDATIMYSVARQTFKGTALTDRQFALMKEKLQTYRNQFTALDYDFDLAADSLRQPLRHIDRSKYIKIVSQADMVGPNEVYESYKEKWRWIEIRFPFSKKLIMLINDIQKRHGDYCHEKGSHSHFFRLTENSVFQIVENFKNKDFKIDEDLLIIYNKLKDISINKYDYIPGVYNLELKNLNNTATEYIIKDIGDRPTLDNLALYKDRQSKYGLHYFDEDDLVESTNRLSNLSQKIVNRNSRQVLINSKKFTIDHLAKSLLELNRLPLLVILSETSPLDELIRVHCSLRGFIDNTDCTVMFRLTNDKDYNFNEYIKNNNLNSRLDKNTKVVYINTNKIPKPLISSDWRGSSVLLTQSHRVNNKLTQYIERFDLVMHYDENASQFMRFQRDRIQEL